ncbi:hypothetical protein [Clavibacter zhangzhiyongii]|uniref:Uncharacterized protein n=1 Tax=Clavibacter zhangzhiyongii TaxID=2768071 RepID=A0A7L7Z5F2_9MICO|nr:hypothetical protein [Clavibacter zhangzhiyongii]QOD45000.1 hypothetical protein H9X71_06755 [Clavibacter zhangzhiyongii]
MWMRRGRDGSEDERTGEPSHAIGVGAVVVILDAAAATGDPSLAGEPVGLVVASASDGLRSVSPVPTARGRAWVVELGAEEGDDAPGRRVVVPQAALRLAEDDGRGADLPALPADDLPPRA